MAEANPNEKTITQVGLTSDSQAEVDKIADMVDKFNRYHKGIYVSLTIDEVPPQERSSTSGRFKLLFEFANRDAQRAFWFGNF
jgi:hypothetical protein